MVVSRSGVLNSVHLFHTQARQYSNADPQSCLNKCRIIGEMILSQCLSEEQGNSIGTRGFNTLIEQCTHSLPSQQIAHCRVIQAYGNFGSHFQLEETPSEAAVTSCLSATAELISWFDPLHKKIDAEPVVIDEVDSPLDADEEKEKDKKNHSFTIRELMHRMVDEKKLDNEDTISLREILEWFHQKGSNHKESAVQTHVQMMTTNGETRLFHDLRKDSSDELFFRKRKGQYRLYVAESDPAPITEIEQFSGWEDKLLIVNTSTSFDEVSEFSGYMSPNKTGPYKISRSKYIGLYKEKNVPIIAELVGKVTFRTNKSKGFVWWNNYGLQNDEILDSARKQLRERDRSDWEEPFPVQVLIFRNQTEVTFSKDSPGGLQNNHRVFPTKGAANLEELSQNINNKTWSSWLE